jgi:hypothetical protein
VLLKAVSRLPSASSGPPGRSLDRYRPDHPPAGCGASTDTAQPWCRFPWVLIMVDHAPWAKEPGAAILEGPLSPWQKERPIPSDQSGTAGRPRATQPITVFRAERPGSELILSQGRRGLAQAGQKRGFVDALIDALPHQPGRGGRRRPGRVAAGTLRVPLLRGSPEGALRRLVPTTAPTSDGSGLAASSWQAQDRHPRLRGSQQERRGYPACASDDEVAPPRESTAKASVSVRPGRPAAERDVGFGVGGTRQWRQGLPRR